MEFFVTARIALRALGKNKLRAGLTVLGVVIGIAAVMAMVSIGQSASQLVQGEFKRFGTNVIVVVPGARRQDGVRQGMVSTLTAADSDAMGDSCDTVLATTPIVGTQGQVIYRHTNWKPKTMIGVGTEYLTVRNWNIRHGTFFGRREVTSAAKVCVVGKTIVARLFQTSDPIGQLVRIRSIPFRIIGVLEEKGANIIGDDQDDIILIPYTTVRKRLHGSSFDDVQLVLAAARSQSLVPQAEQEIRALLLDRHRIGPGRKPDFIIQNATEIANMFGMVTGTMTLMLSSIAGISLVVGGVGIMNIMLVSVTERTREIGIRMAVGARPRDILRQFLVEAVLLSSIGGLFGILGGIMMSAGFTWVINSISTGRNWPVVISAPAAAVALVFAAGVGMFFGYYPARRASQLDPIDALRYE